jgi:ADP-ribosyl-[dinitrogen reductase] hydrolase
LAGRPLNVTERVEGAPHKTRNELPNSGWVLHTLESAIWGLTNTDNFQDAIIQVANLGHDSDTAATVAGALAGAAYGLAAIPTAWRKLLSGEWPLGSRTMWQDLGFINLADRLAG